MKAAALANNEENVIIFNSQTNLRKLLLKSRGNIPSCMTHHRVCNKSNTTAVTSKGGTVRPSGAPEFAPVADFAYPV
jgi:hypothetical protein